MKSLKNIEITIIGCGNMGGAILRGLCATQANISSRITACDSDLEKLAALQDECGVNTSPDVLSSVGERDIIILAVKPDAIADIASSISKYLKADAVVMSIAAGVETKKIKAQLGDFVSVVRLMPNVSCLISKGVTGLFSEDDNAAKLASKVFSSIGFVARVEKEDDLHALTAVSGSGPAFVFSFLKGLIDSGVEQGLDQEMAENLAVNTTIGAAELLSSSHHSADELIQMVASPNGTTEAGLKVLEKEDFQRVINNCIKAATNRSKELAK